MTKKGLGIYPAMRENTPEERTPAAEAEPDSAVARSYLFRGDDNYRSGPVGRSLGEEADGVNIQDFADHVLRKESSRTSRYTSFTTETKIARRFTSATDNKYVCKVEVVRMLELEAQGLIKIWVPDNVYEALKQGPRKLARQAADVRAAMRRNCEILVEGQIPAGVLERTS